MMKHAAGHSIRLIQAYARRETAHWYIPLEIRDDAHAMLIRATGVRVEMIDHHPTVTMSGRTAYASRDRIDEDALAAATAHLDGWIRGADDAAPSLMPPTIPSGSWKIIERMGLNPVNALALTRILHHVQFEDGTRKIFLSDDHHGRRLHYTNDQVVHWRNGVMEIRSTSLPQLLGSALSKSPIAQVIDDSMFDGMTIRMVPTTRRRDNVLQVITIDAGRHVRI